MVEAKPTNVFGLEGPLGEFKLIPNAVPMMRLAGGTQPPPVSPAAGWRKGAIRLRERLLRIEWSTP